jgi:WD40 repeat protein
MKKRDVFDEKKDTFEEEEKKVKKYAREKKEEKKRKENAQQQQQHQSIVKSSLSIIGERRRRRRGRKMSSSGERGGDDPHVLQSLKGGHRNNGITSLAFAPNSRKYIFSSSTGDGSIMFWHVGGNASSSSKNRKRPVRFLGHEKDVLTLAHTQREGEGGRVASGGLDRSVRVWKATA